jgi:hypothetical protein
MLMKKMLSLLSVGWIFVDAASRLYWYSTRGSDGCGAKQHS